MDPTKHTPRHIIITLPRIKYKERIFKAAREKETVTLRLSADISKETLEARRGWKEVFEVMEGKDLHPRFLYPVKLSLRMEGQIKCCGGALSPQSAPSTVDENKSTKT